MLSCTAMVCAFLSASFYMAATFAMKYWGGQSLLFVVPISGAALILAAVFEIEAMRTAEMGRTFIIILALEFMLTLVCAIFLLDERYTSRDILAVCLVFAGIVLLSTRDRHDTAVVGGRAMTAIRPAEQVAVQVLSETGPRTSQRAEKV